MNKQSTRGEMIRSCLLLGKKVVAFTIALGVLLCCAVTQAVSPYAWGYNSLGQLGDGTGIDQDLPVAVDMSGVLAGKNVTAIVGGGFHTVALTSEGKVYAWGYNGVGQLGDGTTINRATPVAVDTSGVLSGKVVTAIAAGVFHTVALTSDGRVYTWGYNIYGQLGDGTATTSTTPVAVDMSGVLSGKFVIAIAAAESHTVVLTRDGQLFAWGRNNEGQLGDGTNISRTKPVAVDMSGVLAGKIVTAIAVGDEHTVVLTSEGKVYGWGRNSYGHLGDGTFINRTTPVAMNTSGVLSGKTVTAIAAGGDHTVALASSGEVFATGNNNYGQLGNGTTTNNSMPVAVFLGGVLSGKTVVAVAAGGVHTVAITSEGKAYSWGNNGHGELGDGTTTDHTTPVAVDMSGGLSGTIVTRVAAGYYHTVALVSFNTRALRH